ncbi:MAG: hypothetical protein WCF63_08945, partial [Acidimicrobiales bacterium]
MSALNARGHGTVFYDSNRKKWFAKVPVGRTASGNVAYRKRQASSRREANEERRNLLLERDKQQVDQALPANFLDFASNHMRFEAINELRATTRSGYTYVLNKYVYPEFGQRTVGSITS